jgi:zinc protease
MDLRVGPGTVRFGAIPNQGVGIERVEALLEEEIERVRREGITERELAKAVNALRSELVARLLTVESKASRLEWHALHQGSPFRINDELPSYQAVTVDDVRRVAETYLGPGNRTVVIARPASGPGGGER